jgi:hypothetical protein
VFVGAGGIRPGRAHVHTTAPPRVRHGGSPKSAPAGQIGRQPPAPRRCSRVHRRN